MSQRSLQKDTPADVEIRTCISSFPPRSFIVKAGAGSGKTTSLVKALAAVLAKHGSTLRSKRQKVACITYTEVAANEIWEDVGNNPLVHVSTIHSFLWQLVRGFQADIRQWIELRIDDKLLEMRTAAANFGPRVQQRTRDKNARDIVRYEHQKLRIRSVPAFTYGTGSDYAAGILGHDDVIKMVTYLLVERALLRTLLAQQFPFVFVDESQDTFDSFVTALRAVDQQNGSSFCLGFFGDPMQKIYLTGIGDIEAGEDWAEITKQENFRCPETVRELANNIRQGSDGLKQERGRVIEENGIEKPVIGTTNVFILPADNQRDKRMAQVHDWMADTTNDSLWSSEQKQAKVLVIVHRMAANRLGFGSIYASLNDKAPESISAGFSDGSSWPVQSFLKFILPLASAIQKGGEFEAMQLLRDLCPLLQREALKGVDVGSRLKSLRLDSARLSEMMQSNSTSTVREVLAHVQNTRLFQLNSKLLSYMNVQPASPAEVETPAPQDNPEDADELSREIEALDAFLACPAVEFWGYQTYINDESPFSTQHGIKGAEFDRVVVVIDDEEGAGHRQFSYEKFFGIRSLSENERKNLAENKETSIERTRRLFYVCCTRARKDLAVVMFAPNVDLARQKVLESRLFHADSIHGVEVIEA